MRYKPNPSGASNRSVCDVFFYGAWNRSVCDETNEMIDSTGELKTRRKQRASLEIAQFSKQNNDIYHITLLAS